MARAGVYFSDVKRARDALLAKGRRPSIDAVRAELGNTGSKTTIHKYLRELEAQDGARSYPVSEAIQELIARLAEQLKSEADTVVIELREQLSSERKRYEVDLGASHDTLTQLRADNEAIGDQLSASRQELDRVRRELHQEQVARQTAQQRNRDLDERLSDAERHQQSLEEKHTHAREALEHFRTAAKEQREQEGRRHEQQVHSLQVELRQAEQTAALKLEQLTQLNKEAASLASELAAVKQTLYREKELGRALTRRIEQLQAIEPRVAASETQLNELRTRHAQTADELAKAVEAGNELRRQNTALAVELDNARLTKTLGEQIAQLQKAVFGADQASMTDSTEK